MKPLDIGVCTWSLKVPDLHEALSTIRTKLGLGVIHLGFWDDSYRTILGLKDALKINELEVSATCMGFPEEDYSSIQQIAATGGFKPDEYWESRLARTRDFADFTRSLGVDLLSTHIGFVPHDAKDPQYKVMVDRLKEVCDVLGERGLTLVMETGQERADDLMTFIDAVARSNIGINFDPANMILYGVGDPVEAVSILKSRIIHVHMKDATGSKRPGQDWGEEVVLGTGEADIPQVVSKLRSGGYTGPLIIEREAGDNRIGDIREGVSLLRSLVG